MNPLYDRGGIAIWHADCRDVLPYIDPSGVALVLTDPPYGIGAETNYRERKRTALALSNDFPPIVGDERPFDPAHLLRYHRLILFGANHYADKLPPSPSWLVWDKLDGLTTDKRVIGFDDNADVELAWTNIGGPARLVSHRWKGMLKASEQSRRRIHSTQKPVALMARILTHCTEPGDLVLDPYMGSGPVLQAAKALGRRAIGIDIEAWCCRLAVTRLEQDVLPLFDAPAPQDAAAGR